MLYKLFSSLKTSVYILSVMCVVFLVGTVFPQGEGIDDYIKAGGKYVTIARALDFLDVFMSPLFIFVSGVLLINLAVCLYDRLRIFLKIKRRTLDFIRLKTHPNVVVLENPPFPPLSKPWLVEGDVGGFDIEGALGKLGFKFKTEAQAVKIFEKGLQYWWLSWFYHVGIILAIIGFFLTALFAFEKDVVLSPDKPEQISLYSEDTRWNQFMKNLGKNVSEKQKISEYTLTLKEFRTEYYQGLKFDYPKDSASRLAMGLGIEKIEPAKKDFSYMPKRWLTSFNVKKPDDKGLDANVRVNKPFRTGGLTLYQMGYEQKIKLFVKKEMSMSVQNKK
ncbi:MAG: cytochrome c biogenesis protein ResB, partial [Nitrospirae bacterium]|nr:cytochrome c biogenesis protein ResB [Nitrospirota bacterium]